jgi:hypothetical protein
MTHEVDNEDRRTWARAALDAFGEQTGQTGYDYSDAEMLEEIAGDLICNLFHLADAAGLDPNKLIERGRFHYDDEVEDPEDDCDECGMPAPAGDPDNNRYHATSCSLHPDNIVTTVSTYNHDARPDDDNEPGDRCKDCGQAVVWIGPSHVDWLHVNDMRNQ